MNSRNPPKTTKAFLKTTSIIHIGLITGQLIFSVIVFSISQSTKIDLKNTHDPFLIVAPLIAVGGFIVSIFMFRKRLNEAINKSTLKEKLMAYQGALISRFAPLEGASLFGIVVYNITGNFLFLLISVLIILYFLTFRPTKDKISDDLNLSYEDKIMFESDDLLV